jgi:hypothetical protein
MAPTKTELIDLFYRSMWTFIAAVIGLLVSNGAHVTSLDFQQIMQAAGLTVVTTVVKVFVSNKLGTGTATEKESAPSGFPQPAASNNATPAR